jgi:hypothetical protein
MEETQILEDVIAHEAKECGHVHRVLLRVEVVFAETKSRFRNVIVVIERGVEDLCLHETASDAQAMTAAPK